jgi:hypothetical protein
MALTPFLARSRWKPRLTAGLLAQVSTITSTSQETTLGMWALVGVSVLVSGKSGQHSKEREHHSALSTTGEVDKVDGLVRGKRRQSTPTYWRS